MGQYVLCMLQTGSIPASLSSLEAMGTMYWLYHQFRIGFLYQKLCLTNLCIFNALVSPNTEEELSSCLFKTKQNKTKLNFASEKKSSVLIQDS